MIRTFIKISLVLLIIVALPMGFYLIREYSALTKNEKMVERVFSTQLESILFAVNQYSENVLKQWSQTLDQPVVIEGELMHSLMMNLFRNNQAICGIRFLDPDGRRVLTGLGRPGDTVSFSGWPAGEQVRVMREFLQNNYQRIEAEPAGDQVVYCFLPASGRGKVVCQLKVNMRTFVTQNLRPQIQQISQDIFYVRIRNTKNDKLLYATDEGAEADSALQTAVMWYLPDHELGIRLKEKTVRELASERSQRDNYLLAGMSLIVLLGFVFVVMNIRKEIRLAEMKSEFVSNVSHEIRTPLALISMYAETLLLKRISGPKKQEEYLRSVQHESLRLADMVNRILDFSRLEKNKRLYVFKLLDLGMFIPEVLRTLDFRIKSAGVSCSFQPGKGEFSVWADAGAVKDVLVNLIDNALKYTLEKEPKLIIRLWGRHDNIYVEVEDNGIGISARHQKYIFNQFYRVTDGDLAHRAKGTGLGLNLVKRIMKAHNGSVSVSSCPGEGSTFILKFPRKQKRYV
ncbi:MAG: sensor histidine kinase [Mangrovibacterium sp.]